MTNPLVLAFVMPAGRLRILGADTQVGCGRKVKLLVVVIGMISYLLL
jgi:hypothetical protein